MNTLESFGQFSNLIIAFSIFIGVIYLIFIGNRFYIHMRRNEEINRSVQDRKYFSQYDDGRLELERNIADLNIQLTRSMKRFEDVNHLVLSGQKKKQSFSSEAINSDVFLKTLGIAAKNLDLDPNLVFVLTPFHPSEMPTYSAIVEAFENYGIRVVRGDEQSANGDILSHIIRMMLSARIVIANLSTRNPNVMYELGIAHSLGKDVVMISNNKDELPFDVNSRRVLFYTDRNDLITKLRQELGRKIFGKNFDLFE